MRRTILMANWCRNIVKEEPKKDKTYTVIINYLRDNKLSYIEFLISCLISVGSFVYAQQLDTDLRSKLVKFMCLIGFLSVQVTSKTKLRVYYVYIPIIIAIVLIKLM